MEHPPRGLRLPGAAIVEHEMIDRLYRTDRSGLGTDKDDSLAAVAFGLGAAGQNCQTSPLRSRSTGCS